MLPECDSQCVASRLRRVKNFSCSVPYKKYTELFFSVIELSIIELPTPRNFGIRVKQVQACNLNIQLKRGRYTSLGGLVYMSNSSSYTTKRESPKESSFRASLRKTFVIATGPQVKIAGEVARRRGSSSKSLGTGRPTCSSHCIGGPSSASLASSAVTGVIS